MSPKMPPPPRARIVPGRRTRSRAGSKSLSAACFVRPYAFGASARAATLETKIVRQLHAATSAQVAALAKRVAGLEKRASELERRLGQAA